MERKTTTVEALGILGILGLLGLLGLLGEYVDGCRGFIAEL